MASALEMPIHEEDESDARYARLSDPGEPSGLAALLCPCLRRAPAYERVEEATPNPLAAQAGDAARDDDPHRGSWLDEADELAASCFACSSAFHPVKNRRHHCRRCGDTYCIGCSSRYQPLLLSGLETPQRVCDACYDAAARDNDFARVHAPVLERGAILTLKGGLFSAKRAVVLRVTGDTLLFLDQASVEAAPRLGIELASVTAVEDKPDGFAIKYDAAAAHLTSPAPRPDLTAALRAAAKRASTKSVRDCVDERRWEKRQAARDAEARTASRQQRDSRAADRQSIRDKYGLR